jgi:hypothetical protein
VVCFTEAVVGIDVGGFIGVLGEVVALAEVMFLSLLLLAKVGWTEGGRRLLMGKDPMVVLSVSKVSE